MADPHVISALREKRAKVAGCIARLERQLDQHRADLSHIDGVLRLFEPDRDPAAIKPKRTYARRTRYFARNELSRLCRESLRDSERLSTEDIVARIVERKGFDAADSVLRKALRLQLLTTLRAMRKRGAVEQTGLGRGVRWKLADGA
jgi:phytoene dehydrogenase-like protein